jgi:drug/metabolite transporter (DMT)-like permease
MLKLKSNKFAVPALYLATIIFAINTYLFRLAGNAMPPHVFIGVRFILAGLLLKVIFRNRPRLTRGAYVVMALAAFIGSSIPTYLFVLATTMTPLLTIGMIDLLGPIWVLLLATLLHQEKLTITSILASGVSMIGAVVLLFSGKGADATGIEYSSMGVVFLIASGMVGALGLVLTKKLLKKIDVMQYTYLQFLFGGIPFLAYSIFSGDIAKVGRLESAGFLVLALTITTNGALPFMLRSIGVKSAPYSVIAQQSYLSLAVIALIAVVFLREPVTLPIAIGCALVLGGTVIGHRRVTLVNLLHHVEYDAKHLALALSRPDLTLRQIIKKV